MTEARPAVFLDRDGTIIVEREYLSDPEGVVLEANAAEGLKRLAALGSPLVVLTNQSGVGRGYYTLGDAERVNQRVRDLLAAAGVEIAVWYICPHAPGEACDCRKPLPGMARQAARDLNLDLSRSVMIGDKCIDLGLADAIGALGILVRTGYGATEALRARDAIVCADLLEAAELIEQKWTLS